MRRLAVFAALVTLGAGGYAPAERLCKLPPEIEESSGVASASWSDDVVWTHNDSGDKARFFGVATGGCALKGTWTVTGAEAVDWEDMTRAGTTLYFGDIGDNAEKRPQVTVYAVPEPGADAGGGPVTPSATHVLRYPDGSHNSESLLVDPTTGRLTVVTKTDGGLGTVYRAPESGQGTMEKIANLAPPPDAKGLSGKAAILATGADAIAGRLVVRTYIGGFEWDLPEGEDLATGLARPAVQVALPLTVQGEAVAYTRDGTGLLVTSEGDGGPVHRLAPAGAEGPDGTTTTTAADTGDDGSGDATVSWAPLAAVGVAAVILSVVFRRNRNRPD